MIWLEGPLHAAEHDLLATAEYIGEIE